jgi:hypothetical protein
LAGAGGGGNSTEIINLNKMRVKEKFLLLHPARQKPPLNRDLENHSAYSLKIAEDTPAAAAQQLKGEENVFVMAFTWIKHSRSLL